MLFLQADVEPEDDESSETILVKQVSRANITYLQRAMSTSKIKAANMEKYLQIYFLRKVIDVSTTLKQSAISTRY